MMPTTFDIAICGAGPVGMALAALLAGRGVAPQRIGLLDAKTLAQASLDPRVIALSHGSRQILEEIGAWPIEATAIHQIHVSRRGQFGRSLIDRSEHDLPALGYVTRYGALVTKLGAACERHGVATLRPARVLSCVEQADSLALQIEQDGARELHAGNQDGTGKLHSENPGGPGELHGGNRDGQRELHAGIVVQAEGGLFGAQQERAPERTLHRDYGQTALIAQVSTSAPLAHRAYERFTEQGPLALLPLDHGYSLVWCVRPGTAQALLALDDAAFLAQLGAAFGTRLGRFTRAGPRAAYRLGLNADARASGRSVAIGNAAQTLHPVAGQGLNLGLRDAAVLARLLAQGATPAMLARFTGLRQADRATTVRLTDTMARIFANESPAQALLGMSLGLIDMVSPARHLLAELMLYGRR